MLIIITVTDMTLSNSVAREELKQQLTRQGYRLTQPREIILELLRGTSIHPDANWIYDQVRKRIPHISLGTVYRTMSVLAEAGLIQELHFGDAQARYDGNVSEHYHVICMACGALEDIHMPPLRELERVASELTDYHISGHRVEFYGLCSRCQRKGG